VKSYGSMAKQVSSVAALSGSGSLLYVHERLGPPVDGSGCSSPQPDLEACLRRLAVAAGGAIQTPRKCVKLFAYFNQANLSEDILQHRPARKVSRAKASSKSITKRL
jgi:hypothetical protein